MLGTLNIDDLKHERLFIDFREIHFIERMSISRFWYLRNPIDTKGLKKHGQISNQV